MANNPQPSHPTNSINFVNKDNRPTRFFCRSKKVSNSSRTHSNQHLHKLTPCRRKERNICLSRHRFGHQSLATPRRSHQKNSLWCPRSNSLVFLRMFEKINNLPQFLLCLLHSANIGKGNLLSSFSKTARPRLTKGKESILSPSCLPEDHGKEKNHKKNRSNGRKHLQPHPQQSILPNNNLQTRRVNTRGF